MVNASFCIPETVSLRTALARLNQNEKKILFLTDEAGHLTAALTDGDVKAWLDLLDSLNPEGMPSMRQDTAARRKTEVELFSGTIRRLGKKYSVKTPVNDFLYEKIKEMEAGW